MWKAYEKKISVLAGARTKWLVGQAVVALYYCIDDPSSPTISEQTNTYAIVGNALNIQHASTKNTVSWYQPITGTGYHLLLNNRRPNGPWSHFIVTGLPKGPKTPNRCACASRQQPLETANQSVLGQGSPFRSSPWQFRQLIRSLVSLYGMNVVYRMPIFRSRFIAQGG